MSRPADAMRNSLIVPGAQPEQFAAALAGPADALALDLLESVVLARKAEARGLVGDFLRTGSALGTTKLLVVRCNPHDSGHYREDLEAVLAPALGLLNLVHIDSAAQLRAALPPIARLEEVLGLPRPVRLLVDIGSPAALRNAAEIAAADPRVAGLQLALGDLCEASGLSRGSAANLHAVQFALRMAAAESGVFAFDGPCIPSRAPCTFEAEARSAQALGFHGKACIDAAQVRLAREVFVAEDAELAMARRIAAAARAADDAGHGMVSIDGRMLELHDIRRAQALVAAPAREDAE